MSPQLEQIVIFTEMSVLVTLFVWIYVRNPQQRVGLWMLGWSSIFIHSAAGFLATFSLLGSNWAEFIRVGTLDIAGTSFVLSVSQVYATRKRRILYFLLFGFPSVIYTALAIWVPQRTWLFPTLILGSTAAVMANSWRYYRVRSISIYLFLGLPGAYAIWSATKAVANPEIGVVYFLTTFFAIAGLLYIHFYKRFTPGVVATSVSFFLWAMVFPLSTILGTYHIGPSVTSMIWDLPKFMVAFGMILTLFENETAAAMGAARQYRNLFEGNLAAVYLSTFDGTLLDCNIAFVNMYGYSSKEELLGHPTTLLYLDPKDRWEFLRRLQSENQVINYECPQRRKDGSALWILERATLFASPSGQQLIEGTAIDITERKHAEIALKESEERFATIFRHNPVGCGIVSLEGVFLDGNPALGEALGRPIEEIVGKTGVELGLWKSQVERDQFYSRLRAEGSIRNMEIEFFDEAGNKHIGLYYGTLVKVADKECIFGMQLDYTKQRELEAKFLQAQKMEAVGRLAGGVAHDFNNLLGVIGGYAELLEAGVSREEKLRTYCSKILDTTLRARNLTSQLLTFSRKRISEPVPVDPNQALQDLATLLARLIGEDVELVLHLESTGAIVIDKTHFEQIIINIAVNARDAMPDGGLLNISTRNTYRSFNGQGQAKHVDVTIRDTGTGMDEATRLRAFEPFFTTKEVGRGTGLGLSTVYGIVQQCGGDINIESRLGEGTQISVSLPATEMMEMEEEKDMSLELLQGSGHILMVEDEVDLRNANAEFLGSLGYSVTGASNGPEALELLAQVGHIDLAITDVVMPKMNGPEFANRLLQARPDTKLLFVSGYADDVVLKTGMCRPDIPFLQKPYTLRQLAAKIREVLASGFPTLANGD